MRETYLEGPDGRTLTLQTPLAGMQSTRRPLCGGVDRNDLHQRSAPRELQRRPLCGGVDRNIVADVEVSPAAVAPFAGAWIETPRCCRGTPAIDVAPRRGGVDRNYVSALREQLASRPPRGGVDRNLRMADRELVRRRSPPARGRGSKLLQTIEYA